MMMMTRAPKLASGGPSSNNRSSWRPTFLHLLFAAAIFSIIVFTIQSSLFTALFLFGAWASQAAAEYNFRPERPIKPPRKQFGNDNSEVETKTETPEVNSSPAPPTKTTPPAPDQSSTPILESVDRIANRAEMSDSIVQPHSQNCGESKRYMGGWSPLVIGAVLFYLLQPGLIFQWPGNNRKLEFKTEKTNGKAMFIHTMIFIVIYVIIIALSHGKI